MSPDWRMSIRCTGRAAPLQVDTGEVDKIRENIFHVPTYETAIII